jgi:hypothetical protein
MNKSLINTNAIFNNEKELLINHKKVEKNINITIDAFDKDGNILKVTDLTYKYNNLLYRLTRINSTIKIFSLDIKKRLDVNKEVYDINIKTISYIPNN